MLITKKTEKYFLWQEITELCLSKQKQHLTEINTLCAFQDIKGKITWALLSNSKSLKACIISIKLAIL